MKYPKVLAFCLNFRVCTAKFSGVLKFRNFTVLATFRLTALDQTFLFPSIKTAAKHFQIKKIEKTKSSLVDRVAAF